MPPPIPAAGYAAVTRAVLTPARPATPSGGLTRVEQRFPLGLPHRFRLDDELEAVLLLPTGLATQWRDVAADELVTSSAGQRDPHDETAAAAAGTAAVTVPPARLAIRSGGEVAGVVPLVAGSRSLVRGSAGALLAEIEILDWDVRAGAVRGPGDAVSRLVIAWRRADRAVEAYSVPPAPRRVLHRLPLLYRMESDLGLRLRLLPRHHWSKAKWLKGAFDLEVPS